MRGRPEKPVVQAHPARRAVVRAARALVQGPLERVDPAPRLLRRRTAPAPAPRLAVVSVYRLRFAPTLRALVSRLGDDVHVALWGLDGVDEALAEVTLGSGPGERFTLLNRLLAALSPEEDRWVLLTDDDVRFKDGDPVTLAQAARHYGLDLSQPAHAWDSEVGHPFTRRRLLVLARRTSWVEQGPVVLFSPEARRRLLPLPEEVRWPGWGVEALWCREERRGLRLGIVDGVTIVHLQPVNASGYSSESARTQERALRRRAGFDAEAELQFDRVLMKAAPVPMRLR